MVVPVYKVEGYLRPCVDSILGQDYKNLEVILVDDGSPDQSGDMCDDLASRHKRVRVIHQKNGGLSNARNSGMKLAHGEYVMFVDSDDILPKGAISALVDGIGDAEVATGNVNRFKGKRTWQSWNQLYSHSRGATWDGGKTAPAGAPVALDEAPELLFDTTAWNKLFRRSFLEQTQIEFPEGKLYEDMLPMAQAFLSAPRIVKVPAVVYLYREREDKSSITQKRDQLRNLADKMEMVGLIEKALVESKASANALDTLYFKVLEGDLPVYSPYLGLDPAFDKIYLRELRKYWSLASNKAKLQLTLDRRVLFLNQLFSEDPLRGEAEAAWAAEELPNIPRVISGEAVEIDPEFSPHHLGILAEHGLLDAARHVELRSTLTDAFISDGTLCVQGYAFLDGLPEEVDQTISLSFTDGQGSSVDAVMRSIVSPCFNTFWSSGTSDHSASGFEAIVALDEFEATDESQALSENWAAKLTVTAGAYSGTVERPPFWRGGRVRIGETAFVGSDTIASLPWQPRGRALQVELRPGLLVAAEAALEEGVIRVRIRTPFLDQHDVAVSAVRVWDDYSVEMTRLGRDLDFESWFEADLMSVPGRTKAGGDPNEWRIELNCSAAGGPIKAVAGPAFSSGIDLGEGWSTRANSDSTALLFDGVTTLEVAEVERLDTGYVLRGTGNLVGTEHFEAHMWGDNNHKYHSCEVAVPKPGVFEVYVDCTVSVEGENTTTWLPGEYRLSIAFSDQLPCRYRVRAARSLVASFPTENVTPWFRGRWHVISDTWEMSLGIFAPLLDTERGRYNELEAQRVWREIPDDDVQPLDAIVFSVNMASSAADSELAIFQELRKRCTPVEYYWAVSDLSKWVPEGATPVVRGSAHWFELMNRAKLVVNNYGGILGYGNRAFQRYLQTWHGTPLKYIGDSEFATDARSYARKRLRAEGESGEWDWFLSPNPFMSRLIPSEFYFDGEVLELGYPRNDSLVDVASEDVTRIRRELGIPTNAKVLLYAPTFRDATASGYSSPLVNFLDVKKLTSELGSEWFVLLRGHSFNARADSKDRSAGRVMDVTTHPDVNDLMTASDVLVTDYSSIMFDYLVTGKPIIHFAPDLDSYLANRGMYLDYGDVASLPVTHDYAELLAEVNAVSHLGQGTARRARYAELRDRFVPWDDGGAAGRVVDFLLEQNAVPSLGKVGEE